MPWNSYGIPGTYLWGTQPSSAPLDYGGYTPGASYPTNAGPGGPPPAQAMGPACSPAYIAKYTAKFGYAPWCPPSGPAGFGPVGILPLPRQIICPTGKTYDPIGKTCIPFETAPPIVLPPTPPPAPVSPVSTQPARHGHRRHVQQPSAGDGAYDVCPIRGYVSRPILGADEYQNFKCTPGEQVRIDRGLAAAGAAGAYARQGGGPSIWTGQHGGWGPNTAFYNPRPRFIGGATKGRADGGDGFGDILTDTIGLDSTQLLLLGALAIFAIKFIPIGKKRR